MNIYDHVIYISLIQRMVDVFFIFTGGHRLHRSIPLFVMDPISTYPFDLHQIMDCNHT
jgi:hypothetical protein